MCWIRICLMEIKKTWKLCQWSVRPSDSLSPLFVILLCFSPFSLSLYMFWFSFSSSSFPMPWNGYQNFHRHVLSSLVGFDQCLIDWQWIIPFCAGHFLLFVPFNPIYPTILFICVRVCVFSPSLYIYIYRWARKMHSLVNGTLIRNSSRLHYHYASDVIWLKKKSSGCSPLYFYFMYINKQEERSFSIFFFSSSIQNQSVVLLSEWKIFKEESQRNWSLFLFCRKTKMSNLFSYFQRIEPKKMATTESETPRPSSNTPKSDNNKNGTTKKNQTPKESARKSMNMADVYSADSPKTEKRKQSATVNVDDNDTPPKNKSTMEISVMDSIWFS